ISDKVEALHRAMGEANRHGLTAVSDIPGIGDLPAYEQLAAGDLSVRFFLYPTAANWSTAVDVVKKVKGKAGWVEIKGFKQYVDGSLGSKTAYMHEPYLNNSPDKKDWRGLLTEGAASDLMKRNLTVAHGADLQPIAHSIGDEANHILLTAYENEY